MKPDKTLPKAYQTLKPEVLDLQNKLSPEPSKATDQRLGFRDNLTRVSLSWGAYMRDKGAHRGFQRCLAESCTTLLITEVAELG